MSRPAIARAWLAGHMAPHWQRVHGRLLNELAREWDAWIGERIQEGDAALATPDQTGPVLVHWLKRRLNEHRLELGRLQRLQGRFDKEYSRAENREERERILLDHAAELGATRRALSGDRRALRRWFDRDAMIDRFLSGQAEREHRMAFILACLGRVAAKCLTEGALWQNLDLEEFLLENFSHDGDQRVALAAFHALAEALKSLPHGEMERLVAEPTVRYIYRSALESHKNVWVQAEALALLSLLSLDSLVQVLNRRLGEPGTGDDMFLRRRAAELLVAHWGLHPDLESLPGKTLSDPSPFVRQGLADALRHSNREEREAVLERLGGEDSEPSVRISAVLALTGIAETSPSARRWLIARLAHEKNSTVYRALLQGLVQLGSSLSLEEVSRLHEAVAANTTRIQGIPERRWTAQAAEKLWLKSDPVALELSKRICRQMEGVAPGKSFRLPKLGKVDDELLGRVLSVLAQDDFPLEASKRILDGYTLHRGHRFAFRWWRFLHELKWPSPDKRQGFSHVVGRHFRGYLRAPSAILNEMSPTKVPGEPLFLDEEGGWRPFLPLVDDLLSTLEQGRSTSIFTSQGITEIHPPGNPFIRIKAMARLTRRFEHFARLRNFQQVYGGEPSAYLDELSRLGFTFHFRPYQNDSSSSRFFPAVFSWWDSELGARFKDYFYSSYENSIYELILFATAASGYFLGRHLYLGAIIRRERAKLPLVIGGWGTRGKSGTERLKAAVFHALGLSVISKTTGCEAMFLHAPPFMPMREMFLFRPYDKATIWEQHNLVQMSARLGTQVFLWECMALTPSYVHILQRRWMRDDFSTIVNAYPDHEDLQGPAGINIPEVIAQFIPERSRLVSSEEQMAPILRWEAQRVGTEMDETSWLDAALLTPDILARFPYAEHPNNIALVTRLFQHLGLPADESLKAMADHVIPDIGVLKVYPPARVDGRQLSFVNGMSANERLGSLGNWRRTGFAGHDPELEPEQWLITVVNNRADRVSRSKVFARMLVRDVAVDRHVLIGGNLEGLKGYIKDELEEWKAELTLWPGGEQESPGAVLRAMARWMRIPVSDEAVSRRLAVMGENPDESWQSNWRKEQEEFSSLDALLSAGSVGRDAVDKVFREQIENWFWRKVVIIWDYHATGEEIMHRIVEHTPPGTHGRIMGMQNIKGTGMDFVYRWQAWDQCHRLCSQLTSSNSGEILEGIRGLSQFRDFGILSKELVAISVDTARGLPETQNEKAQVELEMVLSNLNAVLAKVKPGESKVETAGRWDWLIHAVEAFIDAGDAVKRRKKANQIYQDLVDGRISRQRATNLLADLIKRQKGGWLKKRLLTLFLKTDD